MHRFSIIGLVIISFVLQSCSYSSPKEALESNIIGKNSSQKTDAKTSRRAPEGNRSPGDASTDGSMQNNYNAKRSSSNYDAYQHYQSANPPKKAKRRPLLNLKELNDLMDKEATITLTEKTTTPAPEVDANSNLQEVIKYNKNKHKHKSKPKTKKRVKVLVVKKEETVAEPAKPTEVKKEVTKTSNKPALPAVALPQTTAKAEEKATNTLTKEQNNNNSQTKPKDSAPAAKINQAVPESKPDATAIPSPEIQIPAPVVTVPAIAPANPVIPTLNATSPTQATSIPASPSPAAPKEEKPVTEIDTSKMSKEELEQHLKDKFSNDNKSIIGNENFSNSYTTDPATQNSSAPDSSTPPAPLPSVPLPAIPNATESNMDTGLSRLNSIFICCYYDIKHKLMSLMSSWFGFEW